MQKTIKEMRKDAERIYYAGIQAVDPEKAIYTFCQRQGNDLIVNQVRYDLTRFNRIIIVGAGKASAKMAAAIETILGGEKTSGIVVVKYDHTYPIKSVKLIEAGHPIPDEQGMNGASSICQLLKSCEKTDLVIYVLSGGGSALLVLPALNISLKDKQDTVQLILSCGASIKEMNTIRKHISLVKGGQLARYATPATQISLILSDVVGDDLDVISSGPTVPDNSTFQDCLKIIRKYHLENKLPNSVIDHLQQGVSGKIPETSKKDDDGFKNHQVKIIASNIQAIIAAQTKAKQLGYQPIVLSSMIEGDTTESALFHAAIIKEIIRTGYPIHSPACILSGGETTVRITGSGKGGRNQEFALAIAPEISGEHPVVVLSGGTDGTDGPTDAAGAYSDHLTYTKAIALGLDPSQYLKNNDSYSFFKTMEDLLITGPTFTNVMDIRVILV